MKRFTNILVALLMIPIVLIPIYGQSESFLINGVGGNSISSSISRSGNRVTCTGSIEIKRGVKADIKITLQKKADTGAWIDFSSNSTTTTQYVTDVSYTFTISNGIYRTKSNATIYDSNGSIIDTISSNSSSITY